jgi:carboxypeptidase family protein
MRLAGWCAIIAALTVQQPREAAQSPSAPTGTALIAGRLLSDERAAIPIRRARVTLNSSSPTVGRTVITDDEGRFTFAGLPAAHYLLAATKSGYVTANYGARRPGRAGTPIALADGQQLADVTLRIMRGGVIAGRLRDQNGDPSAETMISLKQYRVVNGERTLVSVPFSADSRTDDRGQFRIFGLAPGEYYVAAEPPGYVNLSFLPVTAADVQRASTARSTTVSVATASPARVQPVGYSTVFFPGTTMVSNATPVIIGPGEAQTDVDFQIQLVPTAKVEFLVSRPDGPLPSAIQVSMTLIGATSTRISGRATPSGTYVVSGVTPGRYNAIAEVFPRPAPATAGSAPGPRQGWWASTEITVDGRDIVGQTLSLRPHPNLSGRVVFEGTTQPPDVSGVRVDLLSSTSGKLWTRANASADGSFVAEALRPGKYLLRAVPGAAEWILKSAVVNGRDAADTVFEMRPGENLTGAVITFTNRQTSLSGMLQDATGRAASDYFIVLFSADRGYWTPKSRRIAQTRPASNGAFSFTSPPPGEYFIAALTDVEQDEWYDPTFLEQLIGAAVRLTLAEGEKKVQDLRIAR